MNEFHIRPEGDETIDLETSKIQPVVPNNKAEDQAADSLLTESADEDPVLSILALHSIWSRQLASREDRISHGHFEGDLAHHFIH